MIDKIDSKCNVVGLLHDPFWRQLVSALSGQHFLLLKPLTIHLSRSLYLNFNYLVSVTASGPVSTRGHMSPSSTVDFGWFVAFGEHQNFPCLRLIEIVILWVYCTIPFGFNLFWHLLVITFQLFKLHCLAKDHWRGFSTRNAHMAHIVNLIRLKMVYTSQ